MKGGEDLVVACWEEHTAIGHHDEELTAEGRVHAWTEPPSGEVRHPGDDNPDDNPICDCPLTPRAFCQKCAGCADYVQCSCRPGRRSGPVSR